MAMAAARAIGSQECSPVPPPSSPNGRPNFSASATFSSAQRALQGPETRTPLVHIYASRKPAFRRLYPPHGERLLRSLLAGNLARCNQIRSRPPHAACSHERHEIHPHPHSLTASRGDYSPRRIGPPGPRVINSTPHLRIRELSPRKPGSPWREAATVWEQFSSNQSHGLEEIGDKSHWKRLQGPDG
ncbi:hypothetical protein VUR80DRAFT_10216 [Thermomyces stellatus]